VLKGREKIDSWLRGEAGVILGAAVSPKTVEQYKRNGARLHAAREKGKPVDLSKHEGSSATFYAYRAAVRWYAATEGIKAVREYSAAAKFGLEDAKAAAWQRVLHFAADLVQYPKDAKPGLPSARAVALGLDDPKPEGAPARAKREGRADTQKRETAKLKAANSIARKYPDWRALVWARLVAVKSPWLDHAAIAALTGARPDELRTAQVRRTATGIEIGITGAKVSDTKGQPWRLFALRDDGSDEYRHIAAMASKAWRPVGLPDGVTDYPDAFSAALARAGAQVLPGAERLSGYVYRHAFASDLKADGATKEQIAQALGHAVTKTQDAYGRAIGGKAGRRLLAVSAAREVRATHDTRYTNPTPAPTHADVHAAPAQPWGDGFVMQDSPTWQSPGWEGPQ
jgi:integrase